MVEQFLCRVDRFLIPIQNKIVFIVILSILFSAFAPTVSGFINALCLVCGVVWLFVSFRIYGWLDTISFIATFPFVFIAALASVLLSQKEGKYLKIKDFEEEAARIVVSSINESYEGKLVESRIVEGQIYITIETPYGLRFPVNTVHRQIAGDLHIKETSFLFEQFLDTRSYFVFSSESYKQYKSYVDSHQSIATFSYIIDRLLCTSDIHITQVLSREYSKF